MCAIMDANRWHEMFSRDRSPAAAGFRRWLEKKQGFLVLGGKLRREVAKGMGGKRRVQELRNRGQLVPVRDAEVDAEAERLEQDERVRSDDPHILALARVSGARLLYTNDKDLQKDFRDSRLLRDGRIYTSVKNKKFDRRKKVLLRSHRCQRRR